MDNRWAGKFLHSHADEQLLSIELFCEARSHCHARFSSSRWIFHCLGGRGKKYFKWGDCLRAISGKKKFKEKSFRVKTFICRLHLDCHEICPLFAWALWQKSNIFRLSGKKPFARGDFYAVFCLPKTPFMRLFCMITQSKAEGERFISSMKKHFK